MNKTILFSVLLGVLGGFFWIDVPFKSSKASTDEAYAGIAIGPLERLAHRNTVGSFDDHHQSYMGVLDVLRGYPAP